MISNANSAAVQNKLIFFFLLSRTKFSISYLDGHGTETKNNFDSVTRSLK